MLLIFTTKKHVYHHCTAVEFKLMQSLQHQQQNVGFSYLFKVYKPIYFDILYTIIWLVAFWYLHLALLFL